MKSILSTCAKSFGIAFILYMFQKALNSDYIFGFLEANLVMLQVALLGLNSATLGLVLTKIRDIQEKHPDEANFESTRQAMVWSIREQIALIPISLIILVLRDSPCFESSSNFYDFISVSLIACFAYSILVLYDVAMSAFILLKKG